MPICAAILLLLSAGSRSLPPPPADIAPRSSSRTAPP